MIRKYHNHKPQTTLWHREGPSQHSMLGHHRQASETPFQWRFAGGADNGPLLVEFGSSPHQLKKKQKKKTKNVVILDSCACTLNEWLHTICDAHRSKKEGKDQESIKSSPTPDPGYQWESDNFTNRHQPQAKAFPSRGPQGINKTTRTKA